MSPHLFTPDPDLPPDHRGWRGCAACGVLDDPRGPRLPRHRLPDVPEQAAHRSRYDHDEEA